MLDKIQALKNQGLSPAKIAATLNSQGLKTARGKDWAEHSVSYQLTHANKLPGSKTPSRITAKSSTASVPGAAKRAPARKAAARRTQPGAALGAVFAGGNLTLGRRIDLAKEILGVNDLDPAMRVQVASKILNG